MHWSGTGGALELNWSWFELLLMKLFEAPMKLARKLLVNCTGIAKVVLKLHWSCTGGALGVHWGRTGVDFDPLLINLLFYV